jgi:hypothetical protein
MFLRGQSARGMELADMHVFDYQDIGVMNNKPVTVFLFSTREGKTNKKQDRRFMEFST